MSRSLMRPISTVTEETLISPHNELLVFWWRPAHDGQVVDVTAIQTSPLPAIAFRRTQVRRTQSARVDDDSVDGDGGVDLPELEGVISGRGHLDGAGEL